jgi:hypothetical protein
MNDKVGVGTLIIIVLIALAIDALFVVGLIWAIGFLGIAHIAITPKSVAAVIIILIIISALVRGSRS